MEMRTCCASKCKCSCSAVHGTWQGHWQSRAERGMAWHGMARESSQSSGTMNFIFKEVNACASRRQDKKMINEIVHVTRDYVPQRCLAPSCESVIMFWETGNVVISQIDCGYLNCNSSSGFLFNPLKCSSGCCCYWYRATVFCRYCCSSNAVTKLIEMMMWAVIV